MLLGHTLLTLLLECSREWLAQRYFTWQTLSCHLPRFGCRSARMSQDFAKERPPNSHFCWFPNPVLAKFEALKEFMPVSRSKSVMKRSYHA